ncbi:hypothetical protein [uncultured Pseudokineococcus sp.]|uniref:hypothetical protein n=1 Tax=uncultured Pseudokineococcus sp. TaxID=1642928 RepID=UPI00261E925E|nr:hypothetical protein [uncultured Pseudokineococcus sp.]
MSARRRERFEGAIAGVGTAEGTRVVLGHWRRSPFGEGAAGAFTDAMVERADGHRVLLAPTDEVGEYVSGVYRFDEVRVVDVRLRTPPVRPGAVWEVEAGPLRLRLAVGRRTPLGALLRLVPGPVASAPAWATAVDPVARRVLRGVSTRGSAGGGRREWYGARDVRALVGATTSWDGRDLGPLVPVEPPVRFGFGSTPPAPSLVRVVSTVEAPDA